MKKVFFQCNSGISGDMVLAALIDAGADYNKIEQGLQSLKLDGWSMAIKTVSKNGIRAKKIDFTINNQPTVRHLNDIITIINQSDLNNCIKTNAIRIFTTLAKAEAKCHNTTIDKVHFHEVGAIDSILDIVGTVISLDDLDIEEIYASPLPIGGGTIKCEHGIIPIPAPAVAEMLHDVPIYGTDISKELITPTGLAILKSMNAKFGKMPEMTVKTIGTGAGTRDLIQPNILQVFIGEIVNNLQTSDDIITISTTIDDMTGELLGYLWEKIIPNNAIDMWYNPIYMKKGRPGIEISILCNKYQKDAVATILFKETSTIGLKITNHQRIILPRTMITIPSKYGTISYKVCSLGNITKFKVEMENVKKIALNNDIPLQEAIDYANNLYKTYREVNNEN